jgi:hypothetical protein
VLEEPQCDKFLSKPFSNAAFLAAVRELLFSRE